MAVGGRRLSPRSEKLKNHEIFDFLNTVEQDFRRFCFFFDFGVLPGTPSPGLVGRPSAQILDRRAFMGDDVDRCVPNVRRRICFLLGFP